MLVGGLGIQTGTAAEQQRKHLQVDLVDELGGEQRLRERAAAGDEDRAAVGAP